MIDITIVRASVNVEALDEQLRATLGGIVSGFSLANGQVTLHLFDKATPAQIESARSIAINHDPAALSPSQQVALIRRQKLDQARRDYGVSEIDPALFAANPLLQSLAQKIVWLEREINILRANSS
jgi:hypothetical protein